MIGSLQTDGSVCSCVVDREGRDSVVVDAVTDTRMWSIAEKTEQRFIATEWLRMFPLFASELSLGSIAALQKRNETRDCL